MLSVDMIVVKKKTDNCTNQPATSVSSSIPQC